MQLRVYEDFARVPRTPPPPPSPPAAAGVLPGGAGAGAGPRGYGMGGEDGGKDGAGGGGGVPPAGSSAVALLEHQYLQWQNLADAAISKGEGALDPAELQVRQAALGSASRANLGGCAVL